MSAEYVGRHRLDRAGRWIWFTVPPEKASPDWFAGRHALPIDQARARLQRRIQELAGMFATLTKDEFI